MLNANQRLLALFLGLAATAVLISIAAASRLADAAEPPHLPLRILLFLLIALAALGMTAWAGSHPLIRQPRPPDAAVFLLLAVFLLFLHVMLHAPHGIQIACAIVSAKQALLAGAAYVQRLGPPAPVPSARLVH